MTCGEEVLLLPFWHFSWSLTDRVIPALFVFCHIDNFVLMYPLIVLITPRSFSANVDLDHVYELEREFLSGMVSNLIVKL